MPRRQEPDEGVAARQGGAPRIHGRLLILVCIVRTSGNSAATLAAKSDAVAARQAMVAHPAG